MAGRYLYAEGRYDGHRHAMWIDRHIRLFVLRRMARWILPPVRRRRRVPTEWAAAAVQAENNLAERALPEIEAFVVANSHPRLAAIYRGTQWAGEHGHMRTLRRLPGASAGRHAARAHNNNTAPAISVARADDEDTQYGRSRKWSR